MQQDDGTGLPQQRVGEDEQAALCRVRQDLVATYADVADPETVAACFDAVVAGFAGAPVRAFVPVMAERRLRELFARSA